MRNLIRVLFLLLGFVGGPLWAAGIDAGGVSSSIAQPGLGLVVEDKVKASAKKGSTQLVRDSSRIGVGADEIRSFLLKPGVEVTRSQFFPRYGESLGLGKEDSLQEKPVYTDPNGAVHVRYEQTYKGIPVMNSLFHLWEEDGLVRQAAGSVASGINMDITPSVSEAVALEAALNEISAESYPWEENPQQPAPKGDLTIVRPSGPDKDYRLAFRFAVPVSSPEGFFEVLVDAKSGEVISVQTLYREMTNTMATGQSFYNGQVSFLAGIDENGQHVLKSAQTADPNFPMAKAGVTVNDLNPPTSGLVKDSNADGNFSDPEDKAAVSAKWGIDKALEFFSSKCGWSGFDGSGAANISVNLRPLKTDKAVAWYVHGKSLIEFNTDDLNKPGVDLSTVGHEFSHGIVDHTSKLIHARESGALNEGFAQYFGAMVDNSITDGDWGYIADVVAGCCGFPNTYKGPNYQPPTETCDAANDYCGVHKNGWVLTLALAYLSQGFAWVNDQGQDFKVEGIGKAKTIPLAFLTMTTQLPPNATFKDAANGLMTVAELTYGKNSPEYISVVNALYAVGLGEAYKADQFNSPLNGETEVSPWPAKFEHEVPAQAKACEIEVSPFSDGKLTKKDLVPGTLMSKGGRTLCTAAKDLEANTVHVWKVHYEVPPQGISNKFTGIFSGLGGASRRAPAASPEASKEDWTWSEEHHFTTGGMEPNLISPGKSAGAENRRKTKWSGLSYAAGGDEKPHPWPAEFLWKAPSAPHLEGFEIQVADQPPNSESSEFSGTVYAQFLSVSNPAFQEGGNYKKEFVLKVDKTYYWRVRAKGPENKRGLWSELRTFKTDMPKPSLLMKNGALMAQPWSIPLEWSFEKEAQKYKLYLSKDSQLGEDEAVTLTTGNLGTFYYQAQKMNYAQYKTAVGKNEGQYYWAVVAQGPAPYFEWGAPSAVDTFKVDYSKTKPVLIYPKSPAASVPYGSTPVTFSWGSVELANQYKLAIYDRTPAGCGNVISETLVPGNSVSPNAPAQIVTSLGLPGLSGAANETLGKCWQVTAVGPTNILGEPSDKADYFIGPDAPVILSPANGADAADYEQLKVQWTSQWAPQGYKLCFQNVVSGVSAPCVMVASGTFEQQVKLAPDTTYQTILTAYGPNGTSTHGAGLHVFKTKQAPAEEKPKDDCSVLPLAPDIWNPAPSNTWDDAPALAPLTNFQWVPVANAASYEVQIVKFNPLDPTQNVYLPVIQVSEPQAVGFSHMPYAPWGFWMVKVQAKDKCGNVSPTTVRQYKVLFN